MEYWSVGVMKLNRFEFRVPGCGLKYYIIDAAAHNPQLVTRNTQRRKSPSRQCVRFENDEESCAMTERSLPIIPPDRSDDLHGLEFAETADLVLFMAGNQSSKCQKIYQKHGFLPHTQ
jgi:hypothetical protein